jgi:hypothetical protein
MGKGAAQGEEAALTDSGRAGEVAAGVGRVRRATFSASCEHRDQHRQGHTTSKTRSRRDINTIILSLRLPTGRKSGTLAASNLIPSQSKEIQSSTDHLIDMATSSYDSHSLHTKKSDG